MCRAARKSSRALISARRTLSAGFRALGRGGSRQPRARESARARIVRGLVEAGAREFILGNHEISPDLGRAGPAGALARTIRSRMCSTRRTPPNGSIGCVTPARRDRRDRGQPFAMVHASSRPDGHSTSSSAGEAVSERLSGLANAAANFWRSISPRIRAGRSRALDALSSVTRRRTGRA